MKTYLTPLLLIALLATSANANPKYGPKAKPLSAMTNLQYFQKNKAPDYWSLSPYYLPQETGRGCSAANISMILNAARVSTPLSSADELITFKTFTEKYADAAYKESIYGSVMPTGENFSNKNLTRLLNEAAQKLKIPSANPSAEFFEVNQKDLKKSRQLFTEALKQNEKSADDFIFFSFIQGKITGDPEGGAHVATVAAYDAAKKLVLVMDPDRQWYEPYWTSEDDLFDAISDPKSDSRKEAGWIHFTLHAKKEVIK